MLNAVIRFALTQRMLVMAIALFLIGYGTWHIMVMPIDVFPDLNRPRVVIMTEAPGMRLRKWNRSSFFQSKPR